jgi:hypothetical protein
MQLGKDNVFKAIDSFSREVQLQELSEQDIMNLRYNTKGKLVLLESDSLISQSGTTQAVSDLLSTGAIRELTIEEKAHIRLAFYYLKVYNSEPDSPDIPNIEKAGCYLEAFYHLCKIKAWEEAAQIIGIRFETSTNEESLIPLRSWAFYKLEQYSEALEYLQAALEICRETGASSLEAITLYDLAILHLISGEIALDYCEQALVIAKELRIPLEKNCLKLKIILLDSEARMHMSRGNQCKAIELYKQRLTRNCSQQKPGLVENPVSHKHSSADVGIRRRETKQLTPAIALFVQLRVYINGHDQDSLTSCLTNDRRHRNVGDDGNGTVGGRMACQAATTTQTAATSPGRKTAPNRGATNSLESGASMKPPTALMASNIGYGWLLVTRSVPCC